MRFALEIGPTFTHLCDASAVAPLGGNQFFVSSDEPTLDGKNQLKIYEFPMPEPVQKLDISKFLRGDGSMHDPDSPEADIESATRIGNTIYWISSHGRDGRQIFRPDRQRFFAISLQNGVWRPLGAPYTTLLADLMRLVPEIAAAEAEGRAPESGGASIEGLCQGQGDELLIGFRSPLLEGRALVVPLLNPLATVTGKAARLGAPFTLDLQGQGIRDWLKVRDDFWFIIAGSSHSGGSFALFSWNGHPATPPVALGEIDSLAEGIGLDNFNPEGLLQLADGTCWLLSDDGDRKFGGRRNKDLPASARSFRSAKIVWET